MIRAFAKAAMFIGVFALFVVIFNGIGESTENHSQDNAEAFRKQLADSRNRELETGIGSSDAQSQQDDDWGN